jgi:ribose transport system ATP-binding protein
MGEMYPPRSSAIGAPMLEVHNLTLEGHFHNVSLSVGRGEIVGLTGLLGSGVKELVQCLFGLERADSGRIAIDGKDVSLGSPVQAVGRSIAMLPEDRRAHGVAMGLSIADNVSLASLSRYSKAGLVSSSKEAEIVDGLIRDLSIKTPNRHNLVKNLSGGNQQKVAIANWLSCQSRIYVLDEPTVAVDVGAKLEIYTLLNRLAAEGAAILLMSSELEELVGMCDRTIVVYRGEMVDEFKRGDVDTDGLLAAASGAPRKAGKEIA